jgi:chaperonin cofactor prefoldin
LVKSDIKNHNQTEIDPIFTELKHRSVIESLDARCESLKKRNEMMKRENDLLRSELAVIQAAGSPLMHRAQNG